MFDTVAKTRAYRGTRCEDRVDVIGHAMGRVLIVADGAGGSGGAAEAADSLLLWARTHVTRIADIRPADQWVELLAKVDQQIRFQHGETTGVIVAVWNDGLSGASVGDSAAWLVSDGQFDNLSANQVHKPLIGTGQAKPVGFQRSSLGQSTVLLASDGLIKYAPPRQICETSQMPGLLAAADKLVELVRLRSGAFQDDVGIVLCRWREKAVADSPAAGRVQYSLDDES